MSERMIIVVRSWPRLSQTFILNEVLALERRGVDLVIVSLVHSDERLRQPHVADVRAPVHYLDDTGPAAWWARAVAHVRALAADPRRYLATLGYILRRPQLAAGYATCSALRCFDHAVRVRRLVAQMRRAWDEPAGLHAHFAHDPTLVALLAHRLTGVPYSFTAHARDLYQIPGTGLAVRAGDARAVVTCCQVNADYLARTVPPQLLPPVHVIHHGVDLDRFVPCERPPSQLVRLVTVGRLVGKKGFDHLLEACAVLHRRGHDFTLEVYGDGERRTHLVGLRDSLGLDARVTFHGEGDRDDVLQALNRSDVFVLTPRETDDGDRDGIPNVLVEAMACGLPVVTTAAGGIVELARHRHNALVAPAGDVSAIAGHLEALVDDPGLRASLGREARRTAEAGYDADLAAHALDAIFRPARLVSGVQR